MSSAKRLKSCFELECLLFEKPVYLKTICKYLTIKTLYSTIFFLNSKINHLLSEDNFIIFIINNKHICGLSNIKKNFKNVKEFLLFLQNFEYFCKVMLNSKQKHDDDSDGDKILNLNVFNNLNFECYTIIEKYVQNF